tara:strand:- start:8392 stop:8529 length:138 start_codon:yes stop_codon:yes gene_type:complete
MIFLGRYLLLLLVAKVRQAFRYNLFARASQKGFPHQSLTQTQTLH